MSEWRLGMVSNKGQRVVYAEDGQIALVTGSNDGFERNDEERDRHARLIAAAPPLYKALAASNSILLMLHDHLAGSKPEMLKAIRDQMDINTLALAKARGDQS